MKTTAAVAIAAGLRLITTEPTTPFTRCMPASRKIVNATMPTPPITTIFNQFRLDIRSSCLR
jgi:hypothetical protein